MRTSSLLFAVASTATLAAAQSYDYGSIERNPLTAQAPACATSCFAIKVQQGDALVGRQTNSTQWTQANVNCFYDNCAASDVPTAVLVLQTLCADLGVAVPISAVTGPATTVSLPPVTLNSGSSSVGSGSATAITSGAMSESTGLVTTTDATGGVVVGPGGGIRTSIDLNSASTLPIGGASSTVSGALGSASSGVSSALGTASSALSGAASSATGAVGGAASSATSAIGGAASSVQNGASSILSAASGGLQSAVPSNPVSAAGNTAVPVAFSLGGLFLAIFA